MDSFSEALLILSNFWGSVHIEATEFLREFQKSPPSRGATDSLKAILLKKRF